MPSGSVSNMGYKIENPTGMAGKSLKFSAYVQTDHEVNCTIYVMYSDGTPTAQYNTVVPVGGQTVNVSTPSLGDNISRMHYRLSYNNNSESDITVYTDDWCLEEVTQ